MILDENEALKLIKQSKQLPSFITKAREMEKNLKALVKGINFHEVLIKKIEHLESHDKASARRKYARDISDTFTRLLRLTDNVYHSSGFSKSYNIKPETTKNEYIEHLSKIAGGQSIQDWHEANWLEVYHTDPNGVIFYEYKADQVAPYPTYKSVSKIRDYLPKGQRLDYIIFEPKEFKDQNGNSYKKWRIVDDQFDRMYKEEGNEFSLLQEETFQHPFRYVPALINSNIEDVDTGLKVSPLLPIIELMKEYARDQSIKSIYKFTQAFPIHWRYVVQCRTCTGTGKTGGKTCPDCDGHGYYRKKDVTDMVTLPVPKEGDIKLAPDIAGHVKPDLETWNKYDEEIKSQEDLAYKTLWGTIFVHQGNETATGRWIDTQPAINRLNKYSDVAQYMEQAGSELVADYFIQNKQRDERVASISYGRNFIIQPLNTILEDYERAKEKGDNSTILDKLLLEYITAKYKNDPIKLETEKKKANIEPYIHLSIDQVSNVFGQTEAQKKVLFSDWWSTLATEQILATKKDALREQFNTWFNQNKINNEQGNRDTVPREA